MKDINKKLEEISQLIDTINFDKVLEDKDAKNITDKINSIDNLISEKSFGKDELDSAVTILDKLNRKTEEGSIDYLKEATNSINNKRVIKDQIKIKYDELFKQQEVIENYIKKYDPQNIVSIKEDRIEKNEDEIKNKKDLMSKIEQFKNKEEVRNNIDKIESLKNTNKVLVEAEKKVQNIQKLENKQASIWDQEGKKIVGKEIDKENKELKDMLNTVNIAYNNDAAGLAKKIPNMKIANKNEMDMSAINIDKELGKENDNELKRALKDLTIDSEKITEKLNFSYHKINGEVLKLRNNTKDLKTQIDLIKDDLAKEDVDYKNISSNFSPTSYVPTNEEIENDPDYNIPKDELSKKEKKEEKKKLRKEILEKRKIHLRDKAGIEKDAKGRHPIIWLKSHFATKKLDEEIMEKDTDYEQAMMTVDRKSQVKARKNYLREKAGIKENDKKLHPIIWAKAHFIGKRIDKQILKENIKENIKEKLIKERQQEEHAEYQEKAMASARKDCRRNDFINELTYDVLNKKGQDVNTSASQAYHKVADKEYTR